MKKIYTLKILIIISIFWAPWLMLGQNIQGLQSSMLPEGAEVKGLCQIQGDTDSGKYLKEQNDVLTLAPMVKNDESFYFWIVENVKNNTFQLYSAKHKGKLVAIDAAGTAKMIADRTLKTTELVFRIRSKGPERTNANSKVVAMGYISTLKVAKYALSDCQCNKIVEGNGRFKVLKTEFDATDYTTNIFQVDTTLEAVTNAQEKLEKVPTATALGLSIYPNPVSTIVNFRFNTQDKGQANIVLHDITGKQVRAVAKMLNGKDMVQGQINIEQLPVGIYILKLQLPNGTSLNKKIIKK
ncbi:T9SS type A sorting domain-containing protein [Kordia sp.]|uniref:T9SS type A sorting domain-containing protein n=1 Tax=Kordia sp. TaxID=1965332 RepID=UPI003D2BEE9E